MERAHPSAHPGSPGALGPGQAPSFHGSLPPCHPLPANTCGFQKLFLAREEEGDWGPGTLQGYWRLGLTLTVTAPWPWVSWAITSIHLTHIYQAPPLS